MLTDQGVLSELKPIYDKRHEVDDVWIEISACHHETVPYDWHGKKDCVAEKMDSVDFSGANSCQN